MDAVYVPLLRAKQGEIDALTHLSPRTRPLIRPLLDVPYDDELSASDLQLQLAETAKKLARGWGTAQSFYFDLSRYPPTSRVEIGKHAWDYLFFCSRQHHLRAIPVAGPLLDRGPERDYLSAIAAIARQDGRGAALRLTYPTFSHAEALSAVIRDLASSLHIPLSQLDIILDAESLIHLPQDTSDAESLIDLFTEAIGALRTQQFRSIVIAASSFPDKTSRTLGQAPMRVPRTEMSVWRELAGKSETPLVFGDYGITFPKETDPDGPVRVPAKIRLSTISAHLVFKGPRDKYVELCQDAAATSELADLPISWGLRELQLCSIGGGYGSPTDWVARDSNAHIETTASFIASTLTERGLNLVAPASDRHPWLQDLLI